MNAMKKITVVGGGLAGLSAAYRLLRSGMTSVNLIEARPNLGGRVQSRNVRGRDIDFGGFLVYPWYEESHRLFKDLGIQDRLDKTPLSDIYYFLDKGGMGTKETDVPFSVADGLRIWGKSLFQLIPRLSLSYPDLDRFDGMTVSEYLRATLGTPGHAGLYETFFDTVNQGYCYGPVTETKASFMAPIVRQVKVHGDIRTTSFFPDGGRVLTNRLAQSIVELGGKIYLGTTVVGVNGTSVQTKDETFCSDSVVFAQTVSPELYRQIVPGIEPDCSYTHFVTAAVELDDIPVVGETREWGASFYASQESMECQALSVINLGSLYGRVFQGCVMVNIVVRGPAMPDGPEIDEIVRAEVSRIFPNQTVVAVADVVHWPQTMPVSQESFVRAVRAAHGKNGQFFAGDFLGAPSMETAVATGAQAATDILAGI